MKKLVLCILLSFAATAQGATDFNITISGVGCDGAGTCFANVAPAVNQTCNNNAQVRWDGSTSAGKNFTAAALTAKAAGLTVNIGTIDASCNGNFPVMNFITVAG